MDALATLGGAAVPFEQPGLMRTRPPLPPCEMLEIAREPSPRALCSINLAAMHHKRFSCDAGANFGHTMIEGHLDRVDREFITGWAANLGRPGEPVRIAIEIDGALRWKGDASAFRQDLQDAGIGAGLHAFFVATSEIGHLPLHEASVTAWVDGTDMLLPGSPKILPSSSQSSHWPADSTPADVTGTLDEVSHTFIRGWAFDRARPNIPVSLDLFLDGGFVARTEADHFRNDLLTAGFGTGRCAFFFAPPLALLDGKPHRIQVVPTNLFGELPGSPLDVLLDSATPVHHVAHLQSRLVAVTEQIRRDATKIQAETPAIIGAAKAADFYRTWYDQHVRLTDEHRVSIFRSIQELDDPPLISVIIPTYNTDPTMLRAALSSVQKQVYPHWECCVADDCSTRLETRRVLKEFERSDHRVKVVYRSRNGHIAEASNSALEIASGRYVAFLDHDDELTEDALFHIALAASASNPPVIYSDEDKIDQKGSVFEPHLKPAFNYSLLLSYNYICHFLSVRRDLIEDIGGFRTETNGSQDYDLLLRLCARVNHDEILHVPRVLYHWRVHGESTALDQSRKSYVVDAAKMALRDHLTETGQVGEVESLNGYYRVRWQIPDPVPRVSVIIPTRDGADVLGICLVSLLHRTSYPNLEVIIVDNGSVEDKTAALFEQVRKDDRVRVVSYDREFNYSAICNFGTRLATGSLLLMMNNDIEVTDGNETWLQELVSQVSRPGVGAVGAKLLYPNGRVQHAGVIVGLGGVAGHSHKYASSDDPGYFNRLRTCQELTCCTAACLLVRREIFEAIGGFDDQNLPVSFNDVDLCIRIRESGWSVVFTPYSELIHHESYSRGPEDSPAKILRAQREATYMKERWNHVLTSDPAYNPSLTLDREDFGMDINRGYTGRYRTRILGKNSLT